MEITTKYKINEEVFILILGEVKKDKVRNILIDVDKHGSSIEYIFWDYTSKIPENKVFSSKEDLIKSL